MLRFIGIGSAFNTSLGNTSAFIRGQDSLLLIDCGSSVFHRLKEADLLNSLKELHIVITHTHPDHAGSLGDLIFYSHHLLEIKPRVYFPDPDRLNTILQLMGVEGYMYELVGSMEVEEPDAAIGRFRLRFTPVTHMPNIPAFGFFLEHGGQRVFYSGDSYQLAEGVLDQIRDGSLDMVYQDTSGLDIEDHVHLSFQKLCQEVPRELRGRVCCIHHDSHLDLEQVRKEGFLAAEVWRGK